MSSLSNRDQRRHFGLRAAGCAVAFLLMLFAASTTTAEQQEADILVVSSRNQTRMQPEIFHAILTSARSVDPSLRIDFVLFNPFQADVSEEGKRFQDYQQEMMRLLDQCVEEVMRIKAEPPQSTPLLERIESYLRRHPDSHLAELDRRLEALMDDFDFLVIESSDTHGAHPIFYLPDEQRLNTPEGATRGDLIETLYGLLLIEAAFRQDKPVWGSCHGAQLGYIHAGGRLGRLFDYRRDGYDAELIKPSEYDKGPEAWHIDHTLNTNKKGTEYFEYGRAIYPLPGLFQDSASQDRMLFLNKDFEHAFGMVTPVPESIEVISFHPLSQYRQQPGDAATATENREFARILNHQLLVDAYTYRTMLGTQYHPQYTYDDLATSKVFDYLVRSLVEQDSGASEENAD